MIGKVIQNPGILLENIYNIDETGVILSMLGSVKVLVSKDDLRDYRGAGVKRTTVTAIDVTAWPLLTVGADTRHMEHGYRTFDHCSSLMASGLARLQDAQASCIYLLSLDIFF